MAECCCLASHVRALHCVTHMLSQTASLPASGEHSWAAGGAGEGEQAGAVSAGEACGCSVRPGEGGRQGLGWGFGEGPGLAASRPHTERPCSHNQRHL